MGASQRPSLALSWLGSQRQGRLYGPGQRRFVWLAGYAGNLENGKKGLTLGDPSFLYVALLLPLLLSARDGAVGGEVLICLVEFRQQRKSGGQRYQEERERKEKVPGTTNRTAQSRSH